MSYDAEDHGQVLLVGHLNPAVLIRIVTPEYIGQPLKKGGEKHVSVHGKIKLAAILLVPEVSLAVQTLAVHAL